MILTITLNTSIDKAYRLATPLVAGTVMRVAECIDNAGGKGLNVSRAVMTCGEEVLATGFAGGNNGRLLRELLDHDGVPHDFVSVESETRCCVNVLEPSGRSTEFLEAGRPVGEDALDELEGRLEGLLGAADVITISGSIPAGLPEDTYPRLISLARSHGRPCILDTSGTTLVAALDAHPTVIKPNTDEVAQAMGKEVTTADEAVGAALGLRERGIETVIVSLGSGGAIMACEEGTFRGMAPKIEIVNPVGAGDTMVGALAVAISRGLAAPERLRYAMACASANCLSASTGHFEMADALRLLGQTVVERMA